MNIKPKVQRLCIVSRTMEDVDNLFRVVKTKDGTILIDKNHTIKGRGAYLKKDKALILAASKRNLLAKALRAKVEPSVYEELLNLL